METERQRMAPLQQSRNWSTSEIYYSRQNPCLQQKKVGRGRCHLQRSPQSPPSLSDTRTHVCIHSIFSPSSTFLYWATWQQQQHMEVGQGRGPPTTPTHQQQLCQPRHAAGRNSVPCQLLCGIFSSPIAHPAISEGIILWSMWHYRCMLFRQERLTACWM